MLEASTKHYSDRCNVPCGHPLYYDKARKRKRDECAPAYSIT